MSEQDQTDAAISDKRFQSGFVPCVYSLFVPGLGQLFQRRVIALFQLVLFVATIACFYNIGKVGLIVYVPLVIYSVLDAAFWTGDTKNRASNWIRCISVPICLLALGVTLLAPAVIAAREAAKRMQCSCTLKGLGLAMHNYHEHYKSLPPAYTVDRNGKPLHSWRVLILPFIEQNNLYEKIRLDEPWDCEHNRQFHSINIGMFQCPSAEGVLCDRHPNLRANGSCFKSVVIGEKTAFPGAKSITIQDITDGTSNTILIVERLLPVCWMDPSSEITMGVALEGINREYSGIGSFHTGVINTAFADGSVQTLEENISREKLEAMLTIAGREDMDKIND